ncbi:putative membrane protein [Pseudoalteromonas translucida]|uniref:Membrane protein n=1 Tax=Pseudoalteromonas translucida (strain TAC 125) TaxID=326442 RepID=Q3IEZ0_PSET1|nr:putative membrane protein [Pseudoalteromonas translucida]
MIDKSITYVNYNTGVYTDKLNFANRILAVYQILRVLKSVILSVILINTL